ncbi:MAG: hypothetical protein Tsb0013_02230 [Phycisphaerales bacterium]
MRHACAALLGLTGAACAQSVTFEPSHVLVVPGAEVVTFEASRARFWCTCADGLAGVSFGDGKPTLMRPALMEAEFTHVTTDRSGRGLLFCTVRDDDPWRTGRLLELDPSDGQWIQIHPAGFGPDCVLLTEDGAELLIVEEGEAGPRGDDPPGGLTVRRVHYTGAGAYQSVGFTAYLREHGSSALRIHPDRAHAPQLDIEPEYVTFVNGTAYVTLQENNAIGVFDIEARSWTDVIPIPVITQTIDASDKDGGVRIEDEVACMPMPDQIVHADGALFFPGEGDTRAELGEGAVGVVEGQPNLVDHARLGDLVELGKATPHPGLERLKVCTFTGDTDGDGVIDVPHAFGSRALHKYDLATKAWSHTGSHIERTIAGRFPEYFDDTRSDDRGPEPEGITVGEVGGRTVLFVSIERPGAVMAFDTDLNFLGMVMSAADGHTGPEGMCFVPKAQSPLGIDTLAVAFEASGHLVFYEVTLDDAQPSAE